MLAAAGSSSGAFFELGPDRRADIAGTYCRFPAILVDTITWNSPICVGECVARIQIGNEYAELAF